MSTKTAIETVTIPHPELSYEQRHIAEFKGFDWQKSTKWDAVSFARAAGFKETGMSVNEIALLYDVLELKKPKTIVELGRNYGCSTRLFLQHIMRHGGVLESWDLKHWDGFLEGMEENDYPFQAANDEEGTFFLHGDKPEFLASLYVAHSIKTPVRKEIEDVGVDFLLIDTEHGLENALGEYMRWREYLRSGACVAFHDSALPAVARAIDLVKEVEASGDRERIVKEYVNERVDGFGIHVIEWKG